MSGKTVGSAILILVIGNLFAILCDVFIKMAGSSVAVYQFTFMRLLMSCLVVLPLAYKYIDFKGDIGLKLHVLRGNLWVLASILLVFSLTQLPLATANTVFYIAPILIVLFAGIFFKEKITAGIVIAAVSGFVGVLIILRPSQVSWGMISAVSFAVVLATNSLLIRKLPKEQNLFFGLLITHVSALPLTACLALWENEPWNFDGLLYAGGSAVCSVFYSLACLQGYRHVASSQVSSAEYSGLLFAAILGWVIFNEPVDLFLVIGALFIIVPLAYLSHQDRRKRKAEECLSVVRSQLDAG
ncbi:DMT family transporter [Vibrio ruber]|uniref:EamA-like transporter family protein n=1 Tax=Vibrio ruber (strain DSM 16370 / JCM 11486 / BCRC 17186 / CECT 7878 / LMG 23124 / VR1) TaxID=1123498 RepID=A0A1R4LTW1_VIBR1|nr:DMT family transporter [Vibrio ruber]WNJ97616.1 DMT family transporter [Vibrio ruber]SJN59767.1 EamA-like transporter family protein [Vibrio ruber DSM 16370]